MDSWIWDQVSLEFNDINVQGAIKSQWGIKRGNDLRNESVQVGVGWSLNVEVSSADFIDGYGLKHNSNISVFQKGESWDDEFVSLNDGSWDLWGWRDGEDEFWFSIVDWESFLKVRSQIWTCFTSDWIEHQETLKTSTVVSELSDSFQAQVDNFPTNDVVTSGEVVGGIFPSGDKLFCVEQLPVSTGSDFINNGRFQIQGESSWDMLYSSGFRADSFERIIITIINSFIRWHFL